MKVLEISKKFLKLSYISGLGLGWRCIHIHPNPRPEIFENFG